MRIMKSLKMAFISIRKNKIRTFLTMLGIIIGVASVTLMITLVQGVSDAVTAEMNSFGTDAISVIITNPDKGFYLPELNKLLERDEIKELSVVSESNESIIIQGKREDVILRGIQSNYFDIGHVEILCGKPINDLFVNNDVPICLISESLFKDSYKNQSQRNYSINIKGCIFQIIGVIDETATFFGQEYIVYIPFGLARQITASRQINNFKVIANEDYSFKSVEQLVDEYVKARIGSDNYTVSNSKQFMDSMSQIYKFLEYLLGGVACISLVVGGIGIMNIMLVSVLERTKEIGIRKAIGAKRIDIIVQFLFEAVLISFLGGLIGIIFSAGVVSFLNTLSSDIHFYISFQTVILALSFSSVIGIVFGIHPAYRAANLTAIEALRQE